MNGICIVMVVVDVLHIYIYTNVKVRLMLSLMFVAETLYTNTTPHPLLWVKRACELHRRCAHDGYLVVVVYLCAPQVLSMAVLCVSSSELREHRREC